MFGRKKTPVGNAPPAPGSSLDEKPRMPLLRDEEKQVHPRLQRMAEKLSQLPQKPVVPAVEPAKEAHQEAPQRKIGETPVIVEDMPKEVAFWEPEKEQKQVDEKVVIINKEMYIDHEHSHDHPHVHTHEHFGTKTFASTALNQPVHSFTEQELSARASNAFYAQNGAAFWTISEFAQALLHMPQETFNHHVNRERNDFSSWIQGCFAEPQRSLAQRIIGKNREELVRMFAEIKGAPVRPLWTPPKPEEATFEERKYEERKGEAVHHDEKKPVVVEWKATNPSERSAIVSAVIEDLAAARLLAGVDLAGAREKFIATRTKVFSILTDDERAQVLPRLKDTYEYLRQSH